MDNKDCDVIKDLLPLYVDKSCSESSKQMIEKHLGQCTECSDYYFKMISQVDIPADCDANALRDIEPMKKLKKNIHRHIINGIFVTVIIFAVIMSVAVNRGYQFIRPKYRQLAKKICLSTQEYLEEGKIEDFINSLDPERMYEHDCNELGWLAKLFSSKEYSHTIDINGTEFAVTDSYYKSVITAVKPSTQTGLDYQSGDVERFYQDEWDCIDSLVLPQNIYETIEDKRSDLTVSFEYNGQTYYYNCFNGSSSKGEDREIQIQSNLMTMPKSMISTDGTYVVTKLQQAVNSASIVPIEVYEEYCKTCAEDLTLVRSIQQKYIDMGFGSYRDIYKDRLTLFFDQYITGYGTPIKYSVDTVWYVSGSNVHHCYIKLNFENGTELFLNFEMNDSGTYYIYNIWEKSV